MALSPYEETILDFIYIAQNQPELFTAEDRTDFAKLLATLPRMWKKFPMRSRFGATPILTS